MCTDISFKETGEVAPAKANYQGSLKGEHPVYHRSLHRRERISAIAALASDGLVAVEFTKGTIDGEKFGFCTWQFNSIDAPL